MNEDYMNNMSDEEVDELLDSMRHEQLSMVCNQKFFKSYLAMQV